jgi:hypothetical protein
MKFNFVRVSDIENTPTDAIVGMHDVTLRLPVVLAYVALSELGQQAELDESIYGWMQTCLGSLRRCRKFNRLPPRLANRYGEWLQNVVISHAC